MNGRFAAGPALGASADAFPSPPAALVTPSYEGDFERCRLLCDSVDRFVTGYHTHYLLVAHRDVPLFRRLEGSRRVVVDECDLLPSWLHDLPDPLSLMRRRIWLSRRTAPLRGWHVQQLRRIALAERIDDAVLVYCDSDMAFLKPFDCGWFRQGGALRLYRRDDALFPLADREHLRWSTNAAKVLGLTSTAPSAHDYITTLIAWRRDTMLSMLRRIENQHSKHWVEVVAATRRFSECMIYGRYVDEVLGGRDHFHDDRSFCRVYWKGPALTTDGLAAFIAGMETHQAAIGIQSFTGTDLHRIRGMLEAI